MCLCSFISSSSLVYFVSLLLIPASPRYFSSFFFLFHSTHQTPFHSPFSCKLREIRHSRNLPFLEWVWEGRDRQRGSPFEFNEKRELRRWMQSVDAQVSAYKVSEFSLCSAKDQIQSLVLPSFLHSFPLFHPCLLMKRWLISRLSL